MRFGLCAFSSPQTPNYRGSAHWTPLVDFRPTGTSAYILLTIHSAGLKLENIHLSNRPSLLLDIQLVQVYIVLIQSFKQSRLCASHEIDKLQFLVLINTVSQKKQDTKLLAITSLLSDFQNFFTSRLGNKFATNSFLNIPPCFKRVATLPCEIWMHFLHSYFTGTGFPLNNSAYNTGQHCGLSVFVGLYLWT